MEKINLINPYHSNLTYEQYYELAKLPLVNKSFECPNKSNRYHSCNHNCEILWFKGIPNNLKKDIINVGGATPGCGGEIYLEAMESFESRKQNL